MITKNDWSSGPGKQKSSWSCYQRGEEVRVGQAPPAPRYRKQCRLLQNTAVCPWCSCCGLFVSLFLFLSYSVYLSSFLPISMCVYLLVRILHLPLFTLGLLSYPLTSPLFPLLLLLSLSLIISCVVISFIITHCIFPLHLPPFFCIILPSSYLSLLYSPHITSTFVSFSLLCFSLPSRSLFILSFILS